jgi:hypothetical protein
MMHAQRLGVGQAKLQRAFKATDVYPKGALASTDAGNGNIDASGSSTLDCGYAGSSKYSLSV